MHVYGCAHVSHVRIRRTLVLVCFIQIQPGLALVQEKHAWKKLNTDRRKNLPLHPKGQFQNASLKQRPDVHHNTTRAHTSLLSSANKRTTTAASSRKKQYQSVVPPYSGVSYMYEYHTAAAVVVCTYFVYRVWIRNGYMRKHVVHVLMSRNVTTVWMLTWIPNLITPDNVVHHDVKN